MDEIMPHAHAEMAKDGQSFSKGCHVFVVNVLNEHLPSGVYLYFNR